MLFRLKENAYLQDPDISWIRHGRCYEGHFHSSMKRPPDVVLLHPDDVGMKARLPSSLFDTVANEECSTSPMKRPGKTS